MGPFGKYLIFGTQLYKTWELDFNMERNIVFIHSELAPFLCQNYLPVTMTLAAMAFGLGFFNAGGLLFQLFSSCWSEDWGRWKYPCRRCCSSGGSCRTSTVLMIQWSCFSCTFLVETPPPWVSTRNTSLMALPRACWPPKSFLSPLSKAYLSIEILFHIWEKFGGVKVIVVATIVTYFF